jgi:ADP-ribose pyrophosphatase YjhB (NUDIX family)
VITVGTALDHPDRLAEAKLNAFAVKLLAESFSKVRLDYGEAIMIVAEGTDRRPVYLTVDSRPPEIVSQGHKIWGVFESPEAQDPVATFFDAKAAEAWAATHAGYLVRETDALHRATVKTTVACIIQHQGQVLLVRIGNKPAWTFPEGELQLGETIEGAVRRACARILGLQVGRIGVAAQAPYVNVYLPGAQHFVTLCMIVEYKGGEPALRDPVYSEWRWFPIRALPEPLFGGAQQFVNLVRKNGELDDIAPPAPPIAAVGMQAEIADQIARAEAAEAEQKPAAPAAPRGRVVTPPRARKGKPTKRR